MLYKRDIFIKENFVNTRTWNFFCHTPTLIGKALASDKSDENIYPT